MKIRHIILWLADLSLAIISYFYLTNPKYIEGFIAKIDLSQIQSDFDPQFYQSPEFFELMQKMMATTAALALGIIVLMHSLAFYLSYRRKRGAVAYVKIYCFLAAFSLLMWLIFNFELSSLWVLAPLLIYSWGFWAEKQTGR